MMVHITLKSWTVTMTSPYRTTGRNVNSFFCLMKNPLLCRSARPESSREVRKRCLMAPFARTQSERRRRLGLASGFLLLRSFGIDRLDAPAQGRRAGRQAQMAEDLDDYRRTFDGGDDLQGADAVGAVFHVDIELNEKRHRQE